MGFRYSCTRCKLAKKKTREEPHYIFDTVLEIKAHLKAIHGIDKPRDDTADDYSAMLSILLPRETVKKLQKYGSPFHIKQER